MLLDNWWVADEEAAGGGHKVGEGWASGHAVWVGCGAREVKNNSIS